ncbi:hypothetical protein Tco_0157342 [Tanacetum coccineum]
MEQPQQIIPVDQLVTSKYQSIGRCNKYAVLPNIPCPKECKIVGQLLVDHALSYALTATIDVSVVYLQQFWKPVKPVVNANKTIRFIVDRQEITYTVDMFCATLKLPVETPAHPFIKPATLKYIQPFLKIVSYQGLVDKVSAFYIKNLSQPWQPMFKVFNRYLTSRTSGHDQTKINILQILHAVINRVHVDYASLLWWDFLHYVQQKKDVIQYPRFTKLIIAYLMKKFDSIPQRLKEDYHSIKDDVPLVSVYTTGNVTVKWMLIPDDLLTDDIYETHENKDYAKEFVGDDRERDEIAEVTLLSLALHKTVKITEEQENVVAVEEKILEEDIENIVKGEDEESYASEFADFVFLNDEEDSGTRIEPGSHKGNPEIVDDDDDVNEKKDDDDDNDNDDDDDENDDHDDHALVRNKKTGSLEDKTEKMQTTIPSPPRSLRKDLSSDKAIVKELTISVTSTSTPTTSSQIRAKLISKKYSHIPRDFHRTCRHQGFMIKVDKVLHEIIPHIASKATNDLIDDNLPRVIADVVIQERDALQANVPALISKEFADHVPQIIKELFKIRMKTNVINVHPTTKLWNVLKRKFEKSSTSTSSCRYDAFRKRAHDKYQGHDGPAKGEKSAKRKKTSKGSKSARGSSSKQLAQGSKTYASEQQQQQQEWDAWVEDIIVDEYEVIPENETPELIEEFQNVDKRVPTIYDHEIMEATLRDMMSNQFRDAEEYAYHLEQSKNYMENQIVWESRQQDIRISKPYALYGNFEERKYVLSLHKLHAVPFPEEDLEEKMNH